MKDMQSHKQENSVKKHGSRQPAKRVGGHYAQKTSCSMLLNILNITGSQHVPSKPAEHLDGIDFNLYS